MFFVLRQTFSQQGHVMDHGVEMRKRSDFRNSPLRYREIRAVDICFGGGALGCIRGIDWSTAQVQRVTGFNVCTMNNGNTLNFPFSRYKARDTRCPLLPRTPSWKRGCWHEHQSHGIRFARRYKYARKFWDEEDFGGWARWYTEKRVKVL